MELYDFSINGADFTLNTPVKDLRFAWKIRSDKHNVMQEFYRLTVKKSDGTVAYDSGTVKSNQSVEVKPDILLEYETEYVVSLWVRSNFGEEAVAEGTVLTELAEDGWNGAKWIKPSDYIQGWAPYIRTKFDAGEKKISKAVLYGIGLGIGEFYLNGERTDDYFLEPNSTNYEKTVLYRANDVTKLVKCGGNCLAVLIGEGFYSQSRVWGHYGMVYGNECALVKLVITYEDGTKRIIVTDTENWEYKYSPISVNNVYAGEIYDCRLETPDFALYESSSAGWNKVTEDGTPKGKLTPAIMPPIRIIKEFPCISVKCSSGKDDGAWVFDMGENFAGIYEIKIPHSPRGAVYVIRTSEAINKGGNLDHRSTGGFATQCIQQEIYIARGTPGGETYRPRFTYHGFRYVEITGIHDFSAGYGTMPKAEMIKGLQISTDLKETGRYNSSNEYLNRLDYVMRNTFRSNYHGYPEDCPAREKCGWLGDAEVVCNWGILNYDMVPSYEKYLNDIRTTKEVYGDWLMIAPGKRGCGSASPLWGCAQIILPYWLWKYRGDVSAITSNMDLMKAWVEHEIGRSEDYVIKEGLGDWDPPMPADGTKRMPVPHSSTTMFYEICALMDEICTVFEPESAAYYKDLAEKVKDSIIRHFYDAEKHTFGYWGTNGVALQLGIYPDGDHDALLASQLKLMEEDDFEMPTGIYANKYLVPALLENGKGDYALKYMFTQRHPSFRTMIDAGGTSMWECIEMKFIEDNYNKGVPSYNHPMHGGFLYSYMQYFGGIAPIEPGFARFKIAPCHVEGLDSFEASYDSPYGMIKISYVKNQKGGYDYNVTVPANTVAEFYGKGMQKTILGSGEYQLIG